MVKSTHIQDLCKEFGVSMIELADRSGVDLLKVQAIFLGRWTPSPEDRQKLAAVLQLSVEEVAWGHLTPIQHIYGQGES